jgi:hypothetical protein
MMNHHNKKKDLANPLAVPGEPVAPKLLQYCTIWSDRLRSLLNRTTGSGNPLGSHTTPKENESEKNKLRASSQEQRNIQGHYQGAPDNRKSRANETRERGSQHLPECMANTKTSSDA